MSEESTKQRALRIPLDHYARPDRLVSAKGWLSIVAALATVAYIVWACWGTSTPNKVFSPGTVTKVHAAWDHQCSECHPAFSPVRSDAFGANEPHHRQAVEEKCTACHTAVTHHALIQQSGVAQEEQCAACHREHQGADASLLAMSDAHCTRCHANLKEAKSGGEKSKFHEHLTSFFATTLQAEDEKTWPHPAFRSLKEDPGNIKFNHAIHMTAGLPGVAKEGRPLLTFKLLRETSPEFARRTFFTEQKSTADADLVQLDCRFCHQVDAVNNNGAYMTPVKFEQSCKGCHPLNIDEQKKHAVPHGLRATELKAAVFGLLAAEGSAAAPEHTKERLQQKLLGKPDPLLAAEPVGHAKQLQEINDLLTNVRCKKCHEFSNQGNAFSANVEPANLPTVWLKHAKFNHLSHKAMNCNLCHAAADPKTRPAEHQGRDEETVMIANYDTCVKCHRSAGASEPSDPAFARFVGARSDCVECHLYHAGDLTFKKQFKGRPALFGEHGGPGSSSPATPLP